MGGSVTPEGEMSGWITAVDVESGDVRWRHQTPYPNTGAVTATAGGLIITGTIEGNLLLMDASTGEVLRRIYTGAPIGGGHISYGVNGKQYIAVGTGPMLTVRAPGLGPSRESSVIVYAITD